MRVYRLTDDMIQPLITDAVKQVKTGARSVVINIDKLTTLKSPDKKLIVLFSALAYNKMKAIVAESEKEIAWHGVVEPLTTGIGYYVKDVLIYPQNVYPAYVESDDERYAPWLDTLDDDTYNNIRFQGHSHVNFGSHPSADDDKYYDKITKHIKDYYITFILNKANRTWINVFDIANNVVYENLDIDLQYETEGIDYEAWANEALEESVFEKTKALVPVETVKTKKGKKNDKTHRTVEEEAAELRSTYQRFMQGYDPDDEHDYRRY